VWPTHGDGPYVNTDGHRTHHTSLRVATNPIMQAARRGQLVAQPARLAGSSPRIPAGWENQPHRTRLSIGPDTGAANVGRVRARGGRPAQSSSSPPVEASPCAHVLGHLATASAGVRQLAGRGSPQPTALIIVRDPHQDVDEIAWQAAKIGYDKLIGELTAGMNAWRGRHGVTRPPGSTHATS